MKTEISPITYIMQNFITEDIIGSFKVDAEKPE